MKSLLRLLLLAALCFSAWQWGQAATIQAKAWAAPILIARAWTDSQVHDVNVKPWPWADTWPVAKLTIPALGIEQYVLAGANGAALPFGPGHISGTSLPGQQGTVVIGGHRDTHFGFMDSLDPGTVIILESRDRVRSSYTVENKRIVDARTQRLHVDETQDQLILVTCEPTTTFAVRGPYRLVVSAVSQHTWRAADPLASDDRASSGARVRGHCDILGLAIPVPRSCDYCPRSGPTVARSDRGTPTALMTIAYTRS